MLRLIGFERRTKGAGYSIVAKFDDREGDDGAAVVYEYRDVSPSALLNYRLFVCGVVGATGRMFQHPPCENVSRKEANRRWRDFCQRNLDSAARTHTAERVFGVTKPHSAPLTTKSA